MSEDNLLTALQRFVGAKGTRRTAKVGGWTGAAIVLFLVGKELKGMADSIYASVGALHKIEERMGKMEASAEKLTPILLSVESEQRSRSTVLAELIVSLRDQTRRVDALELRIQEVERRPR